ncbi:response regulator transcription factor [Cohnella silvisoli]|uniref:Response regulator n=1 Tax=Cohnella silvisoli TaxID=2873699 RepID=A0ABV1KX35_9BACL|nr:response regulator [Cohnella silvisoli]MCD9023782.1 response regulator [Cohnella silvisoli]
MNILVVEDEPIALEELESLLKSYEPGHTVYSAVNGLQGLELAKRHCPDLIVTDIRMPGMDGLELIRQIQQINPNVEAIIISGYDDFAYARTGLQLGVRDYLVKPWKQKSLLTVVGAILEQLSVRCEEKRKADNWKIIRELEGRNPYSEQIQALSGEWIIMVSTLNNLRSAHKWVEHEPLTKTTIAELLFSVHIVFPDSHLQVVLFPCDEGTTKAVLQQSVQHIHEAYANQGLNVHSIAVLKKDDELSHEAYARAIKMLEQQIRLESSTYTYLTTEYAAIDMIGVWNQIRALEALIANREIKHIRPQIDRIVMQIRVLKVPAKEIGSLVNDMFTALQFKLMPDRNSPYIDMEIITDTLMSITSYSELADSLEKWLLEFLWNLGGAGKEPRELVHKLMGQIRHGYHRTDSLIQFAAEHHISVSYLSRLFKAEAGMNFSEYLIRVKIDQAKQLLELETLSVSKVGERVGYEDSKYFSQQFKKYTGLTPSEYQKSCKILPPK